MMGTLAVKELIRAIIIRPRNLSIKGPVLGLRQFLIIENPQQYSQRKTYSIQ